MKDDVRKYIYGAITAFLLVVLSWVSIVYVSSCGMTLTCTRASFNVERTPIPTLIPATLPVSDVSWEAEAPAPRANPDSCHAPAADIISSWVAVNSPETEPFYFVDADGQNCEATFADVQSLFSEPKIWSSSALACVSCHSGDLTVAPAQLDLSSYAGIMAGSRREGNKPKGTDIFGDGDWNASLLYEALAVSKPNVPGHEQAVIADAVVVMGKPFAGPLPTATP